MHLAESKSPALKQPDGAVSAGAVLGLTDVCRIPGRDCRIVPPSELGPRAGSSVAATSIEMQKEKEGHCL